MDRYPVGEEFTYRRSLRLLPDVPGARETRVFMHVLSGSVKRPEFMLQRHSRDCQIFSPRKLNPRYFQPLQKLNFYDYTDIENRNGSPHA